MKIVTNLLTNALKYSASRVSLEVIQSGETFMIAVTSDGALIPEKDSENIFTPFYRLKETENIRGSGIGLSLSRTLAEFHSGSLTYRPMADGCNCFTLALPVTQEGYSFDLTGLPETPAAPSANEHSAQPDRYTVLVVEDRLDMRRFIADELLEKYDVREADNGRDALDRLSEGKIDLVISDMMMPVMDGLELCNAVKNDRQFSHIPFILLTAQHNRQSRLKSLSEGADVYMEKPFSPEYLFAQIENLLKNRELLRQAYRRKPLTPASSLAVSSIDDEFLRRLNAIIERNAGNDDYGMKMLSADMGMSESALLRKVKALSGMTVVEFIRTAKLKTAIELMRSGNVQVKEAAYHAGFSSHAYFTTCFQKQYGKTPSEFLKEIDA